MIFKKVSHFGQLTSSAPDPITHDYGPVDVACNLGRSSVEKKYFLEFERLDAAIDVLYKVDKTCQGVKEVWKVS